MSLADLSTSPLNVTLREFVPWLVRRRADRCIRAGFWSLAELGLSETDYMWCRTWAGELRAVEVERLAHAHIDCYGPPTLRMSPAIALGALLFLTESEHARRHATEGTLWPAMRSLEFKKDTRSVLFLGQNGQPTALHKGLLELAARRLGLRHVFGLEGLQNWFSSFYLQFGFTKRGFREGLGHWLSGYNRPQAISHLSVPGDRFYSPTFLRLWHTLAAYRRHSATAAHVAPVLQGSCWVLPDWKEALLESATKHAHLEDLPVEGEGAAPAAPEFIDNRRLVWNGVGMPKFSAEIANLTAFSLSADSYLVRTRPANQLLTQAFRQNEGHYLLAGEGAIELPATDDVLAVVFETRDGECHAAQDVVCFDPSQDVLLFKMPEGVEVPDVYCPSLQTGHAFLLVTAADLMVEGAAPSGECQLGSRTFRLFPQGWSGRVSVRLEGEEIWSTDYLQHPRPALGSDAITCSWQPTTLGNGTSLGFGVLHVSTVHGVTVRRARIAGEVVPLTAVATNRFRTEPFQLPRLALESEISVGLHVSLDGKAIQVRCRFALCGSGMVWHTKSGSQLFNPEKTLTVRAATSDHFSLLLREDDAQSRQAALRDLGLCEGPVFHGRLNLQKATLPRSLLGYGADLAIDRPFNPQLDTRITLARSVIDGGVVVKGKSRPEPGMFTLELAAPIAPTPDHWVAAWTDRTTFTCCTAAADAQAVWNWTISGLPASPQTLRSVVVGYGQRRIGCYWSDTWAEGLGNGLSSADARQIALAIRAFRLPFLAKEVRGSILGFRDHHWQAALSAWCKDTTWNLGGRSIELPGVDDGWLGALNWLLFGFQPQVTAAEFDNLVRAFIAGIDEAAPRDKAPVIAAALVDVSPWLMAHGLKRWVTSFAPSSTDALRKSREVFFPSNVDYQSAIGECAEKMRVDPNFIQAGLLSHVHNVGHATPLTRQNLIRAVQSRLFRRLVGYELLR